MIRQEKNNLIETRNIYSVLEKRREELERIVIEKEKMVRKAPEGKIHLKRNKRTKGNIQFYWRNEASQKNGKYLGKNNSALISKLLQKKYDQQILEIANNELNQINIFLSKCEKNELEQIYDSIPEDYRESMNVVLESDSEYIKRWEKLSQQQLGFEEYSPEHYSAKNERMRSKSEEMIANELKQRNIPYRYESKLSFENGEALCPDFRVLDVKNRKEYIWEHFGQMDDPMYIKKQLKKIKIYEREGYYIGRNLIITYETLEHPLNTRTIIQTIDEYFGN